MPSSTTRRFTFGQLSLGLQIILIFILLGSCSGASNNSVTNPGVSADDAEQLRRQVTTLSSEVRQLRRELHRQR
jgi:hypothetical protein